MASLERRVASETARAAGHLFRGELLGPRRIAYNGGPTHLVTELDTRAEELIDEPAPTRAAGPGPALLGEARVVGKGRGAPPRRRRRGAPPRSDAPTVLASHGRIHAARLAGLKEIRG